jgi:hypothetical protein
MFLNGEQVGLVRRNARDLLESVLKNPPKQWNDSFKDVCKDYGGGTTCGFLCHWLLWRLGVSEQNLVNPGDFGGHAKTIVNRNEAGYTYSDRENIKRIRYNKLFVTAIGTNALQMRNPPDTGDIIYIHEEPKPDGIDNTEHVFVFVEKNGTNMLTAEAGQIDGKQGIFRSDRQWLPARTVKITGNSPVRSLIGWLPIDKFDYRPPPLPLKNKVV